MREWMAVTRISSEICHILLYIFKYNANSIQRNKNNVRSVIFRERKTWQSLTTGLIKQKQHEMMAQEFKVV